MKREKGIRKIKKKSMKIFNFFMPVEWYDFFCLYSASHQIDKSALARSIFGDWYFETKDKEVDLIDDLVVYVQHEWNVIRARKMKKPESEEANISFADFINKAKEHLMRKGVKEELIDYVLEKIRI